MERLPKHVQRVRKRLADGSYKEYLYDRHTRAAIDPQTMQPYELPEVEPECYTFAMACEEFRKSPEYRNAAANSRRVYDRCMNLLADPENKSDYRNYPIGGIRRRHVLTIRDSNAHRPGVANQLVSFVSRLLSFAVDREWIEHNVAFRVERLKAGEWERWSDESLEKALKAFPERLRRAIILALYTGQRLGDCLSMRWSAFDGAGIQVLQAKTKEPVYIPCHGVLRQELIEWKKDAKGLTILQTVQGRPWTANGFQVEWRKAKVKHGVPFQFHGLRKTAAAKLAEAGCSDREIMAITGHRSTKEVSRYTRQADQRVRAEAAIRKLETVRVNRPKTSP